MILEIILVPGEGRNVWAVIRTDLPKEKQLAILATFTRKEDAVQYKWQRLHDAEGRAEE